MQKMTRKHIVDYSSSLKQTSTASTCEHWCASGNHLGWSTRMTQSLQYTTRPSGVGIAVLDDAGAAEAMVLQETGCWRRGGDSGGGLHGGHAQVQTQSPSGSVVASSMNRKFRTGFYSSIEPCIRRGRWRSNTLTATKKIHYRSMVRVVGNWSPNSRTENRRSPLIVHNSRNKKSIGKKEKLREELMLMLPSSQYEKKCWCSRNQALPRQWLFQQIQHQIRFPNPREWTMRSSSE